MVDFYSRLSNLSTLWIFYTFSGGLNSYTDGYTIQQCARELGTNEAYVALKSDILIEQGYELYPQDYDRDFWKK